VRFRCSQKGGNVFEANAGAVRKVEKDEYLFQTARVVHSYNRGMKWHIAENPYFLTGATPMALLIPSV
jgi:hypothetical protein